MAYTVRPMVEHEVVRQRTNGHPKHQSSEKFEQLKVKDNSIAILRHISSPPFSQAA